MVKKQVMLVRPERSPGKDYSKKPDSGKEKENRTVPKSPGLLPPSIEGVITTPTSDPGGSKDKKPQADSVLRQALALDPKERKLLLARLALAEQPERVGDRELGMWSLAVARALGDAGGGEAGAAYGELIVRRSLAPGSAWAPVAAFMDASGFSRLGVVEQQSVYFMLAGLLVKYASGVARKVNAPLTPKFVANNAQHLGAVFENAFPGYLAAGLAPMVAARLTASRVVSDPV